LALPSTRCPAARSSRRWIAACWTAEFNNATSDRVLGFPDVSKICMLQSYHQNTEQFEIMFNKTKYDALPEKTKVIIANAVDAASADMCCGACSSLSICRRHPTRRSI
jgi:TRAP-type mannitol/chloroaromatic compound transport system substrate-binding protein